MLNVGRRTAYPVKWRPFCIHFSFHSEFTSSRPAGIAYSIGMHLAVPGGRRTTNRTVTLDRALEALPLFRLSDSADDGAISYVPDGGGRWRVLPAPGDRLPGTFDQDVYVEIIHRFGEAGFPTDGIVRFTLHSFLRSIGRKVDGRTYDQLRSALTRLERTRLESTGAYEDPTGRSFDGTFAVLSSVTIERRRITDRDQLALFATVSSSEPGDARVVVSPQIRANIAAGNTVSLSLNHYGSLSNPVARRLYRLISTARARDLVTWRISLERLASQLPLTQRYASHLQRVLQPAHEMLIAAGLLRDASFHQVDRDWHVDYVLATRNTTAP